MLDDLHDSVPGLPRRLERRDRGHSPRVATSHGESSRAVAPSPPARLRRRGRTANLRPRPRRPRCRVDLLRRTRRSAAAGGCRHRTYRGLAGRPVPRRDDRPRSREGPRKRVRGRPLRGRLPVPRGVESTGREHAEVPASHRRPRPAARAALRCPPRCYRWTGRAPGTGSIELLPDPAGPAAASGTRYRPLFREFLLGEPDEPSPTSSSSCIGWPRAGTRRTAPRRSPSSTCSTPPSATAASSGGRLLLPTYRHRAISTVRTLAVRTRRHRDRGLPASGRTRQMIATLSGHTGVAQRSGQPCSTPLRSTLFPWTVRPRSTRRARCCAPSCAPLGPSR